MNEDLPNPYLQDLLVMESGKATVGFHAQLAKITEKEHSLNLLASRCKLHMKEVQTRSTILQQYANDLIEFDKKQRLEKEKFSDSNKAKFESIVHETERINEKLSYLKSALEKIHSRKNENSNITSEILSKILDYSKEDENLKLQYLNAEKNQTKYSSQTIQNNNSVIERSIQSTQLKCEKLQPFYEEQQKRVSVLKSQLNEFRILLNNQEQKRQELVALIENIDSEQASKIIDIKQKMTLKANEREQYESKKIKENAQFKLCEKQIQDLNYKINVIDKEIQDIEKQTIEMNKMVQSKEEILNPILSETKELEDAKQKKIVYFHGITDSLDRAKIREEELIKTREIVKNNMRQVAVDKYLVEDKIEKMSVTESDLQFQLQSINAELSKIKTEEGNQIDNLDNIEHQIMKKKNYEQQIIAEIQQKIQMKDSIKNLIEQYHQKERELVQRARELKKPIVVDKSKEINDENRRIDIMINGYKSHFNFISDSIKQLKTSIKNQSLKLTITQSELRRVYNESKSINQEKLMNDTNYLEQSQNSNQKKLNQNLQMKNDIANIQEKINHQKIINSEKLKRNEYHKMKINLEQIEEFSVPFLTETQLTIDKWQEGNISSIKLIEKWNKFLSSLF